MMFRLALCGLLLIGFGGLSALELAHAGTPRQVPGSMYLGPKPAWTLGITETFHPSSMGMPSSSLTSARFYLEVTEATSSNVRTRPALRYSADGVTWDAATAIDTAYITGNGTQAGSTFVDLTALGTPKAWVQFGVQIKNNTGSTFEFANTVLLVEPKGN